MEHIIRAVERVKQAKPEQPHQTPRVTESGRSAARQPSRRDRDLRVTDVEVSPHCLERIRVVAHDVADPRSKSFDVLRTHILQTMSASEWRLLAITSPTQGCGKTFTALNLAVSVARQTGIRVLVADLDLRRPQLADRLGITSKVGVRALLEGRASLPEAITTVSAAGLQIALLPCERASSRSADLMGSPQFASLLQEIRNDQSFDFAILDLPPMLSGVEVHSILPEVDCVLMVAAVGKTKRTELEACATVMKSTPLARIVLNKVPEVPSDEYY